MTAIADLPGPRPLPGIGDAHQIRPDRLHVINAILRERPDGYRRWREVEAVANEIEPAGRPPREHFGFTMSPPGLRVRLRRRR